MGIILSNFRVLWRRRNFRFFGTKYNTGYRGRGSGAAVQEQARPKGGQRRPQGSPGRQHHKDGDSHAGVPAGGHLRPYDQKEKLIARKRGRRRRRREIQGRRVCFSYQMSKSGSRRSSRSTLGHGIHRGMQQRRREAAFFFFF